MRKTRAKNKKSVAAVATFLVPKLSIPLKTGVKIINLNILAMKCGAVKNAIGDRLGKSTSGVPGMQ